MLCVGTDVAIVCAEGVTNDSDRNHMLATLGAHQTVKLQLVSVVLCCIFAM